jgi:hypothetical protein
VGTGHLYDWNSIRPLELAHGSRAVPFGRIPVFAVALKPLSALPYEWARFLWLAGSVGATVGFIFVWPDGPARRMRAAAACWSAPAAICLAFGQDSVWFLFFVAVGIRLLLRGREFAAGAVFSLCLGKPHLALLAPIWLAAQRKWRALLGGVAGGALGLVLSVAAEGWRWPARLLALARRPDFDPAPDRMPNLRGLLTVIDGGLAVEIAFALVIVVAVWQISRRLPPKAAAAMALAGGLLISHHAYVYDVVILLPALLLPFTDAFPSWLRYWALVLLTPIPYFFLLSNVEWPAHLAISGFTVALLAWWMKESFVRGPVESAKPGKRTLLSL